MTPDSGPARRTGRRGPADAHGLAVLLVAILLALGTALPLSGTGGPAFPPLPAPPVIARPVPEAGIPVAARRADPEAGAPRVVSPLNINTASAEALQVLPGIGPALAKRIVAHRQDHGPFQTPEDLLRVPGIGPKRWKRIRPLVRLTEEP